MWALARYDLQLSDTDFYDSTPVQLAALAQRWQEHHETHCYYAGIVAATIANCNRRKGGKEYQPKDFMPQKGRHKAQTPSEQLAVAKFMTLFYNAKV